MTTYVSVDEAKAWFKANGYEVPADDKLAGFCVRATSYIDKFEPFYYGSRSDEKQILAFPRVSDIVDYSRCMERVRNACYDTILFLSNGGELNQTIGKEDFVTKKKLADLEKQYDVATMIKHQSNTLMSNVVMSWLSCYVKNNNGVMSVTR